MSKVRSFIVLGVTTWAFVVCFAVWLMFGVIGIQIRNELSLNGAEFGLLTSTPVLTGALFRLPLGIWTDRFGGRIVMLALLVASAVPVWFASYARELWQFLLLGLALGVVGASFAVGTPYVARIFAKERRGFAMGVFGAGTTGAAINMFIAPALMARYGWQFVPKFYAVVLLITALIFWLLSAPDVSAPGKSRVSLRQQLAVLKDLRVWKYCQYYSIVFGGFTALSVWMPQYFVKEYGLSIAEAALLAACFSLPAGVLRAVGGWLADRYGPHNVTWWVLWAAWISLFLLSYPQTDFIVHTIRGPAQFHIGLSTLPFTLLLFTLGVAFACGMASTFKYVGRRFFGEHGRGHRHRRPGRRARGLCPAHHLWHRARLAGHQLQLFHVPLRRGLGIIDSELHDGSATLAGYGRTDICQRSGCAHQAGSGIKYVSMKNGISLFAAVAA